MLVLEYSVLVLCLYLQDWARSQLPPGSKFIYLDWDTVSYISVPAAWRILSRADPPIHMAAPSGYPAFGTANNFYTAFTTDSVEDFVMYLAAHVLIDLAPECNATSIAARLKAHHRSGIAYGKEEEAAIEALLNSYTDMKMLFTYAMHAHRHTMKPFASIDDATWMSEMPSLRSYYGSAQREGSAAPLKVCDDSNIACDESSRWHSPPRASIFGAHFPVWYFHPPRFRVFNLHEPFGDGHVVSDTPIEGGNGLGATFTGLKRMMGMDSVLQQPLWEYHNKCHRYKGAKMCKVIKWEPGSGSADKLYSSSSSASCFPITAQLEPEHDSTPLWGWENALPSSRAPPPAPPIGPPAPLTPPPSPGRRRVPSGTSAMIRPQTRLTPGGSASSKTGR